jgi:putative membrane protein
MRQTIILSTSLTAALLLVGCGTETTNSNSSNIVSNTTTRTTNTTTSVNTNAGSATERAAGSLSAEERSFINEAAIGGLAEVEMGRVATKNAKSPDVKNFGQRMIDDHTKVNQELTQLASSKGITPPKELDAKNRATMESLSKLTGAQFDKEYMSHMVEDHQKDVAAFQKQASQAKDPELKAFASKTLPTLEEHLQLAKSIDAKVKTEK